MNVDEILAFKKDVSEDYYAMLGCDRSANEEQINTEYKARVKDCHPDKNSNDPTAHLRFQNLQIAKTILTDPVQRKHYDKWLDSGIAMSFQQWRGLKDSVHTSMHWASPRTRGRMLEAHDNDDGVQLSPHDEDDEVLEVVEQDGTDEEDNNDYSPTDYSTLGLRMPTPPPEWGWNSPDFKWEAKKPASVRPKLASRSVSTVASSSKTIEKRKLFATRRNSSCMMMSDQMTDDHIRHLFRTYQI